MKCHELAGASAKGADTLTTHFVEIVPKKLIGKLMTPLFRFGLRKQTRRETRPSTSNLVESAMVRMA